MASRAAIEPLSAMFHKANEILPRQMVDARVEAAYHAVRGLPPVIVLLLAMVIASTLHTVITKLLVHPLKQVPGPRLAALTTWYEFYYDVLCGGTYVKRIAELHEKYDSAVIRIGPNHVHVNDPDFYRVIFAIGSPFNKAGFFYDAVGVPTALGTCTDTRLHQIKRSVVSPGFSPKALASYVPTTGRLVRRAVDNMAVKARQGQPVNLRRHCQALAVDVAAKITVGRSMGLIESREEQPDVLVSAAFGASSFHMLKHFPLLGWLLAHLPQTIKDQCLPRSDSLKQNAGKCIVDIQTRHARGEQLIPAEEGFNPLMEFFLIDHPKKNYSVPALPTLVDEACAMILGGLTTSYTMGAATYAVLSHPDILSRLRLELDQLAPRITEETDPHSVQNLPWLTAIVKETFRMWTPGPGPLPRVVPTPGVTVGPHFLPEGTYISESIHTLHHNRHIFTNPEVFDPSRWLNGGAKALDPYFAPFGKGKYNCIGQNIATHEIAMFLAMVFSRFEMELVDTNEETMQWTDHIVAVPRKPVTVRVVRERW